MDLTWTTEERAFRQEVQDFVNAKLPAALRAKAFAHHRVTREEFVFWHNTLTDHGWGAPSWPKEYGGTGWNPVQRLIFEIESFKAGAPRLIPFGLSMIGPVLMKYGSQAQKDHFLPRMLRLEDWWCQGYSEPGSGSDLASLQCRARRDGDHWIINGTKIWTTHAHWASHMFCLVRTDSNAKAQQGISFLMFNLSNPGITIRPIILSLIHI